MISIVISSYQPHFLEALTQNIKETIGEIPYEVIAIHNPGKMGICEAYNTGAAKATYSYLCFLHEDVVFNTPSWGLALVAHFKTTTTGAIGVAGASYKSRIPVSWSAAKEYRAINLVQHYTRSKKEKTHITVNPKNENRREVVCLDGVFIATRKEIWEQNPFDQKLLVGFHGYDMDFSLQIAQRYKLYVVFDILLEHFSEGNPDKKWLEASIQVSKKWGDTLPQTCTAIPVKKQKELESRCFEKFKKKLTKFKFTWLQRKRLLLHYGNQ